MAPTRDWMDSCVSTGYTILPSTSPMTGGAGGYPSGLIAAEQSYE